MPTYQACHNCSELSVASLYLWQVHWWMGMRLRLDGNLQLMVRKHLTFRLPLLGKFPSTSKYCFANLGFGKAGTVCTNFYALEISICSVGEKWVMIGIDYQDSNKIWWIRNCSHKGIFIWFDEKMICLHDGIFLNIFVDMKFMNRLA